MSFFSKHNEKEIKRQIPDRLQRLTTEEVIRWADSTILLLGKTFDDWRYHDGTIEELLLVTETFSQMIEELNNRVAQKVNK